jgi:uncharacterized glyoxalase superfamily protein PhnB
MHVELRIGDTVVMLGVATAAWKAAASQLHVYVPVAVEVYRHALNVGGISVMEPARKADDPDRRGGFQDPAGNTWWVATQEEEAL